MCRKILIQPFSSLAQAARDISIQRSDHCGHVFSVHGFIVRVVAGPDGAPRLEITQLELKCNTRCQSISGDLPKVIQVPPQLIVPANIAAQRIDMLIATGHSKPSKEYIVNHLGGRLSPSLVFVGAHGLAVGRVDDMVVPIQVRGGDGPKQQSDLVGRRICASRTIADSGQVIKLAWPGRAAAIEDSETQHERRKYDFVFHGYSPGLCSRGLLARMSVYGRVLIVAVNSLRFSVTCRTLSSNSSIFSELTSRVRSSRAVASVIFVSVWRSSRTAWRTSARFSPTMASMCARAWFA